MSDQDNTEELLSEEAIDRQFREIADKFIDLANNHVDQANRENISLALLYTAARYNAFVVASHAKNVKAYDADRQKAKDYFAGQYSSMLDENLDDYRETYENLQYAHLMTDKPN